MVVLGGPLGYRVRQVTATIFLLPGYASEDVWVIASGTQVIPAVLQRLSKLTMVAR